MYSLLEMYKSCTYNQLIKWAEDELTYGNRLKASKIYEIALKNKNKCNENIIKRWINE